MKKLFFLLIVFFLFLSLASAAIRPDSSLPMESVFMEAGTTPELMLGGPSSGWTLAFCQSDSLLAIWRDGEFWGYVVPGWNLAGSFLFVAKRAHAGFEIFFP